VPEQKRVIGYITSSRETGIRLDSQKGKGESIGAEVRGTGHPLDGGRKIQNKRLVPRV